MECRRECQEAGTETPCESPPGRPGAGVDENGVCSLGMVPLMRENRLAFELWTDAQALGWEMARDLHDLTLTPKNRGDLLARVRVIADEVRRQQAARRQAIGEGE